MNWSLVTRIATVWPLIIGAVHAVEAVAVGVRGADKQDAAVIALRAMLGAVEAGVGRDLLNDTDTEDAVRALIDAYVAVMNLVASKRAADVAP